MFAPSYYSQRAAELEAMAKGITDLATREMCLELRAVSVTSQRKSITQQSDAEIVSFAEAHGGKAPDADKH